MIIDGWMDWFYYRLSLVCLWKCLCFPIFFFSDFLPFFQLFATVFSRSPKQPITEVKEEKKNHCTKSNLEVRSCSVNQWKICDKAQCEKKKGFWLLAGGAWRSWDCVIIGHALSCARDITVAFLFRELEQQRPPSLSSLPSPVNPLCTVLHHSSSTLTYIEQESLIYLSLLFLDVQRRAMDLRCSGWSPCHSQTPTELWQTSFTQWTSV